MQVCASSMLVAFGSTDSAAVAPQAAAAAMQQRQQRGDCTCGN